MGEIDGDTVERVAPILGLPFASRCGIACGVSVQTVQKCSNLSNLESHGHADLWRLEMLLLTQNLRPSPN